jgi:hypothetical protein
MSYSLLIYSFLTNERSGRQGKKEPENSMIGLNESINKQF